MNKVIYLDHAAATPVHTKVLEAMLPYFSEKYGNPSTIYGLGQQARQAVDASRRQIADILGSAPSEIVFSSGATESIDIALKGAALANQSEGNHIITSAVEHKAVLSACHFLERFGFEVTYLPVDKYGMVNPGDVDRAIKEKTILVSIMLANNEVGTIEPVADISRIIKQHNKRPSSKILLHTDAVQGAFWFDLNVGRLGVDMLSLSAHKIYGPKGVGILYLKKGTPFLPQQKGGGQERGLRGGTENVPGIVGLATALRLAAENREANSNYCQRMRDYFIEKVESKIKDVYLIGHPELRLPNHASFCFQYIEGEAILLHLDFANIAASSGSACSSGSLEPSHVLSAMGISPEEAHGSVRFTFGPENTEQEIDSAVATLTEIVDRLRAISPFSTTEKV